MKFRYKTGFSLLNNPQNLDLSYKIALEFLGLVYKETSILHLKKYDNLEAEEES